MRVQVSVNTAERRSRVLQTSGVLIALEVAHSTQAAAAAAMSTLQSAVSSEGAASTFLSTPSKAVTVTQIVSPPAVVAGSTGSTSMGFLHPAQLPLFISGISVLVVVLLIIIGCCVRLFRRKRLAAAVAPAQALSSDTSNIDESTMAVPPKPALSSAKSSGNYQGLTNEADFAQMDEAKVVHIISSPYYKTNPIAGAKAKATKNFHDNPEQGIYVFNPNTGLTAAAAVHGLDEKQQGEEWLRIWTDVLAKTKETGGKCFVMAKAKAKAKVRWPQWRNGPKEYVIEGGAQKGEINVAKLAGVPIEYVPY